MTGTALISYNIVCLVLIVVGLLFAMLYINKQSDDNDSGIVPYVVS